MSSDALDNDTESVWDDMASLVGTAPRTPSAADAYQWIPRTLAFTNYSAEAFSDFADRLGIEVAKETLLLMVSRPHPVSQALQQTVFRRFG